MPDGSALARDQLRALLRRADRATAAGAARAQRVSPPAGCDAAEFHNWRDRLAAAQRAGAIDIVNGRGNQREAILAIRLRDPNLLAENVLGVRRASEAADLALSAGIMACGGSPELLAVLEEAGAKWRRGAAWERLEADPEEVGRAFSCASAFLEAGFDAPRDRRSASLLVSGHTKYLDRHAALIASILRRALDMPDELTPAEVFERLGVVAMPHPVCLRAPAAAGSAILDAAPWIGLCPDVMNSIRPISSPSYILTIENWASFSRYTHEVADDGAVLYTAGFPSPDVRAVLRLLAGFWPEAPMYHWGDVDAGGLLIAESLENAAGRAVVPHLMSFDLPSRHWRRAASIGRLARLAKKPGPWGDLARRLMSEGAKTLEQEAIDPRSPLTEETHP